MMAVISETRPMGRPKKRDEDKAPPTLPVRLPESTVKKARILAQESHIKLSDLLNEILAGPLDLRFQEWREKLLDEIQEADKKTPSWREDVMQMLSEYEASGLDYVEVFAQHMKDPKLTQKQRQEQFELFSHVQADHFRLLNEQLLKNFESGGDYGDESTILESEANLYGSQEK